MALSRSEKQLVYILIGVVGLVANVIGGILLVQQYKRAQAEIATLKNDRLVAETWLGEREMWKEREAWMAAHQPKFTTPSESSAQLLDILQSRAKAHDLKILAQDLLETSPEKHHTPVSVSIKLQGKLEAIALCLNEVQTPENFISISKLTLKCSEDPAVMVCDMEITRYYRPES